MGNCPMHLSNIVVFVLALAIIVAAGYVDPPLLEAECAVTHCD